MKKGQGLSVNMLILIALGLAVLIISIVIFATRTKDAGGKLDSASSCETLGQGTCKPDCTSGEHRALGFCGEGQVCCAQDEPTTGS